MNLHNATEVKNLKRSIDSQFQCMYYFTTQYEMHTVPFRSTCTLHFDVSYNQQRRASFKVGINIYFISFNYIRWKLFLSKWVCGHANNRKSHDAKQYSGQKLQLCFMIYFFVWRFCRHAIFYSFGWTTELNSNIRNFFLILKVTIKKHAISTF